MSYDVDVLVVGGGPAGLAAAIRSRWVKGYHALASSTVVIEPGRLGGLLSWGSAVLTGPSWAYSGAQLTKKLVADIEKLSIPIVQAMVASIEPTQGGLYVTTLSDGRRFTSLAVVIATGFRPLGDESDYYLRGVRITYKGYEHFPALIRASASDAAGRGLVVFGNEKTSHLEALLSANTSGAGPVTVLKEGRLIAVEGTTCVEAVVVSRPGGQHTRIPCGALLLDYNALELKPDFTVGGLALDRDSRGFIAVDSKMQTSRPGVFAAGDITGRYAATLIALGDGVCAGFGAYEYAFQAKFGRPPRLFAYRGLDAPLPAQPRDLPVAPDEAVVVALKDAPSWVTGRYTIAEYSERLGESTDSVREMLEQAVLSKRVTFHCMCPRS